MRWTPSPPGRAVSCAVVALLAQLEVRCGGLAVLDRHRERAVAVVLVPGLEGVLARGQSLDLEVALVVGHRREGMAQHEGPRRHPGVDVADERHLRLGAGRVQFYSSGYLTEDEQFPWAEVLGAVDQPTLSTLRATSAATVFEQISVRAPNNAAYHIGDSLMLSRLSRVVPGWGRLVVPTGIARVVAVDGRDVWAQIETQFDRVADGQVALPLEPFRDRRGIDPLPIENGMRGSIITVRDQNPLAGFLNIVFIDRGRADGIVPGDEFEVIVEQEDSELPTTRIGIIQDVLF